jgi:hypothetical protein
MVPPIGAQVSAVSTMMIFVAIWQLIPPLLRLTSLGCGVVFGPGLGCD